MYQGCEDRRIYEIYCRKYKSADIKINTNNNCLLQFRCGNYIFILLMALSALFLR